MKKIPTLYKKDPANLALVINDVNPGCEWVFDGEGIATRKFDGTAAAIIKGELYKRYDVKKGRQVPEGAIPCQDPDAITGHWPHWVKVDENNKEDRYFIEAERFWFDHLNNIGYDGKPGRPDGTYELCGPKVQGNPEGFNEHRLILHGSEEIAHHKDFLEFERIRYFLECADMEGIVFHHKTDGRMCKIRKSDFGIKRVKAVHSNLDAV